MTPFVQGLYVSAVGIVVLFITASIFYLIIVGLQKLFREKKKPGNEIVQAEVHAVEETGAEEEAIAAVIAIAIQNARRGPRGELGKCLLEGRGSWWSSNLLAARENTPLKK